MKGGINIEYFKIDIEDEKYPRRLLKIRNFPTEIYAVGNIDLLNTKFTAGIIGSRNCTDYGRKVSKEFASEMSRKGICIVSGMALGIDGMAHDAAAKKEGRTIAVLGGGFNYIYPKENEWLFYKIIENDGCVISEYSPDTVVEKKYFPDRNRIISGLSDAVLVVEATFRSGSSITAKHAYSQGKKVFAIPNNIYENTGIGTNILIQKGAILTTKPRQIIEAVKEKNKSGETEKSDTNKLGNPNDKEYLDKNNAEIAHGKSHKKTVLNKALIEKDEKDVAENENILNKKDYLPIYRLLSNVPMHINEIAIKLNKSIQEITPNIIMMELDGYIEQVQANYFKRREDKV